MAYKEVCPQDEMVNFPINNCVSHRETWPSLKGSYFSVHCVVCKIIVAGEMCSESCVTTFVEGGPLPAQAGGEINPSGLSCMLKLEPLTLTNLIAKGMMKKFK